MVVSGGMLLGAGSGAVGGFTSSVVSQGIDQGQIDWGRVGVATAVGAGLGAVTGGLFGGGQLLLRPRPGVAPGQTLTPANLAARRWHAIPNAHKQALNEAMTEFGSGPEGARRLLDAVRCGNRPMPSTTVPREALEAYRDTVQAHYLQLLQHGRDIEVMRLRLEIYRLWLGN